MRNPSREAAGKARRQREGILDQACAALLNSTVGRRAYCTRIQKEAASSTPPRGSGRDQREASIPRRRRLRNGRTAKDADKSGRRRDGRGLKEAEQTRRSPQGRIKKHHAGDGQRAGDRAFEAERQALRDGFIPTAPRLLDAAPRRRADPTSEELVKGIPDHRLNAIRPG